MNTDKTSVGSASMPGAQTLAGPTVEVDVEGTGRRDHVRWGPVLAGVVTALAVLLFLTVIGLALGLSALGTEDTSRNWGTAAGIFGGLSLLVAFFGGGWMAARAASPTLAPDGVLNGFVTGAATLLVLVWLATTAVTGVLGFFAGTVADIAVAAAPAAVVVRQVRESPVGQRVGDAVDRAGEQAEAVVPDDTEAAAAATEATGERLAPASWGSAIAIALAVGAATLGGMIGQGQRRPGSAPPTR